MCRQCELKPVYEFINKRKVCGNCFVRWFEKKVFYTLRKFKMLEMGDVVFYKKGNDFRRVVLENVLKMLAKDRRVNIIKIRSFADLKSAAIPQPALSNGRKEKIESARLPNLKIAVPLTTDLLAYGVLNEVINGNVDNLKNKNKKLIAPLILFLDKEILLYAKLKKLKFNPLFSSFQFALPPTPTASAKNTLLNKSFNLTTNLNIQQFVDELEKKHPEVKWSILNNYLNLV